MTGIYCIENTINGMKYIGKADDIKARWRVHRHHLNHNTHVNIHLQRAWNKYGADAFRFYVLEEVEKDITTEAEIKWIKKLDTFRNGYNRTEGGEGQSGRKLTDVQKKHLSIINSGANNPSYGVKRSAETRQRMSESLSKPRKPLRDDHKKRISESCKGIGHPTQNKPVIWHETGIIYKSISEASIQTGYRIDGICKVCRGIRNSIYNQHFSYY